MVQEVLSEKAGQALLVTFNRPTVGNAFTADMANQLFGILKNATTDRAVRVVVLRGGGGNFMDGLDMKLYLADLAKGLELANQMQQPYNSAIRELQAMEKPVLSVVEGNVSGPGLSFMLASDLVIASETARLSCRFTSYALSPDGAASFFLTKKVGSLKANQLLMLNETLTAAEAERLSLVSVVVPEADLTSTVASWTERLVNAPTKAVGAVKLLVSKAMEQGLSQQIALEHTYWGATSRTFDFKEAMKALAAGREPKYTGA